MPPLGVGHTGGHSRRSPRSGACHGNCRGEHLNCGVQSGQRRLGRHFWTGVRGRGGRRRERSRREHFDRQVDSSERDAHIRSGGRVRFQFDRTRAPLAVCSCWRYARRRRPDCDVRHALLSVVGASARLETCIQAMAHVNRDATTRIVGGSDLCPPLERLVTEFGLDDSVEFTGPVEWDEVPQYLNEAAIGVAHLNRHTECHHRNLENTYQN